ncbi:hypothetical protein D3C78_585050 [compost metagenome]
MKVRQAVQSDRLLALGREMDRRPEQAEFDGDGAQGGDRRAEGARLDDDLDPVVFQRDTPWTVVSEALAPVARFPAPWEGHSGTFLVIISGGGGALVCLKSGGLAPPERVSRIRQKVFRHSKQLEI